MATRSATSDNGKPGGQQPLRIDFDDDLADVAALDGDVVNVVDAGDARAGDRSRRSRAGPTRSRPPVTTKEMIGKIDGVCRSMSVLVPAGNWALMSAIFARTSFRACTISVPGMNSMSTCDEPRTVLERTMLTPSTVPTASSMGRVTATSTVVHRQAGRLRHDRDSRKGHFGIDAARHAQHIDHAEDGQQQRGQHDQAEIGPGKRDKVQAAIAARVPRPDRAAAAAACRVRERCSFLALRALVFRSGEFLLFVCRFVLFDLHRRAVLAGCNRLR